MASLFEEDLHSSDSEDDDYAPNAAELSSDSEEEEVPTDDETEIKKKSKKHLEILPLGDKKKKGDEKSPEEAIVDQKQRANDLFKNFLEEVEADMKTSNSTTSSSAYGSFELPSSGSSIKSEGSPSLENASEKSCELFDFAGETVTVVKENESVVASMKKSADYELKGNLEKNDSSKPANQSPVAKPKGLQSVLGTIMNKKAKLTTLQKTSLDWNQYKKEHGISEELQSFNRGKGGFVERQRFLQRSDVRSYEIERDMRMAKRKKTS